MRRRRRNPSLAEPFLDLAFVFVALPLIAIGGMVSIVTIADDVWRAFQPTPPPTSPPRS